MGRGNRNTGVTDKSEDKTVKAPEKFYHFAPVSARKSIATKGLLPSPGDDPNYPQLWLTRNSEATRKGFSTEALDLYEVSCEVDILFDLGKDVTTLKSIPPEHLKIIRTVEA